MTGFGAASLETESLKAAVSVRSLNHRFLDVAVHAPRRLQSLEPDIRRLVQSKVERGRVEVSLQATLRDAQAEVVVASPAVVQALVQALRRLQAQEGLPGEVTVADVARFPGVVELAEAASELDEGRRQELLFLVDRAVGQLEEMRGAEGRHLHDDLQGALRAIEAAAMRIEECLDREKAARRDALLERLRELREESGLDEARLHQEAVRLVDRQDVTEELQRLRSHLAQARSALAADEACGKRLDFLAQEMAREANTIGSKSVSAAVTQEVVGLKSEVERLREQVQNVE